MLLMFYFNFYEFKIIIFIQKCLLSTFSIIRIVLGFVGQRWKDPNPIFKEFTVAWMSKGSQSISEEVNATGEAI